MTTLHSRSKTLTIPLKLWIAKGSAIIFVTLAAVLLFLSQRHPEQLLQLRRGVQDGLVPVVSLLSEPSELIDRFNQRLSEVTFLYQENERLRDENARLLQWQSIATQMQSENDALRSLVQLRPLPGSSYVTARVIGNPQAVFTSSLLLDSGRKLGIRRYQAIISSAGLVGRITESGQDSARVMLITDINSRIPVIGENSRTRAILTGDNTGQPVLQFMPRANKLQPGERIITASDGGVFPAGLPVGDVISIKGEEVRIQPLVDFTALEYVQAVTPVER